MSYDIYIGNAEPDEADDGLWRLVVAPLEVPDAPSFAGDDLSQRRNARHPGYTQWSNFCRMVGLYDFFFDAECGLMREHPGTFALKSEHLSAVMAARHEWKRRHPDAEPRMGGSDADGALARLHWLEWWIAFALHNCERPAIHNY